MVKIKSFLVGITFLFMLIFFFVFQPIDLTGDAEQYYNIAQNLINGNGYSISTTPPYKSALHFREPVYPFVIAFSLLFFNNLYGVIIIQILMHLLTSFLIYKIAIDFMDKRYALLASVLTLLFPTLMNYNFCILTETVFTFFVVLTVYLLYFGLKRQNLYFVTLSGLVCGIAFLTRNIIMLFPLFFTIGGFIIFLRFKKKFGYYKFIKHSALFLFISSVIVFAWYGYSNYIYRGRNSKDPSLVDRGTFVFAVRSELTDLSNKDFWIYTLSIFSEKLVNKFYPECGPDITTSRGFYYAKVVEKFSSNYMNKSPAEIIYGALINHPIKFTTTTLIELTDLNMFFQLPYLNSNYKFQNIFIVSIIRGVLKITGLIILWFAIKGIFKIIRKGYLVLALPLIAIVVYNNLIFIFLDAIPRYSVPIIPFYLLFFIAGFYKGNVLKNEE